MKIESHFVFLKYALLTLMLLVALASTAHSSGDNSGKALTKYAGYELGVSSLKSVQSGLGLSPIVKSGDA